MPQEKDLSKAGNARPWLMKSFFDDFDATASAARQWDAGFVQLDGGVFAAQITRILSPSALLQRCHLANGVEPRGGPPEACRTFGVPVAGCREFLRKGHRIHEDQLVLYPRGVGGSGIQKL